MRRLSRYLVVGAMGAVVQLTVVGALAAIGWLPPSTAVVLGVAAAVLHNFLWHRRWTWGDRSRERRATIDALAAYALGNGVISALGNLAAAVVLVDWNGWNPVAASVVAIIVCGAVNFWVADTRVWRRGEAHPSRRRANLRPDHVASIAQTL
jgi:putative flippase GtrA